MSDGNALVLMADDDVGTAPVLQGAPATKEHRQRGASPARSIATEEHRHRARSRPLRWLPARQQAGNVG
ncbi:MAG: hypothetical protein F2840_11510 [Actinobacteria bacterium]|nr:hypothetical protein [Actinomycetota bacterium]